MYELHGSLLTVLTKESLNQMIHNNLKCTTTFWWCVHKVYSTSHEKISLFNKHEWIVKATGMGTHVLQ